MDKKWTILICVFSVLTFISSVIGSSIIFMNDEIRTEANSNKVLANKNIYKSTSIVYEANNNLRLNSLNPGYNLEQKFSITNNNSNTIKYIIEWQNISSDWNSGNGMPEEFSYSVNCSNGEKVENKQMPLNNEVILDNLELETNKTNECTIKINFINTGQDQSYNLNKTFTGTYKVIIKE